MLIFSESIGNTDSPIPIFASSFQGLLDGQIKFSLGPTQQLTLILGLSVAQILHEKYQHNVLLNKLGFIDVLSTVPTRTQKVQKVPKIIAVYWATISKRRQ